MGLHCVLVWASFWSVALAQVKILSPLSLRNHFRKTDFNVPGSTSVFGAPYYGEKVLGRLRKGTLKGAHFCKDSDYDIAALKDESYVGESGEDLHPEDIMIIPHDDFCSGVSKVLVAERKGAKAVILVDQKGRSEEEITSKLVGDDGYGDSVKIPSVLVSLDSGNALFSAMQSGPVLVELAWDVPQSVVTTVDYWRSSGSREAAAFLQRFATSARILQGHMQFVPHYYVFEVPAGVKAGNLCADYATNAYYRHCAPDPDGPGPITGADVANEDVRQLCLWHTSAVGEYGRGYYSPIWWTYVTTLMDKCPMDATERIDRFGSKTCSYKVMQEAGADVEAVTKCVKENQEKYLEQQSREKAWSEEALRINGWKYEGPLDPEMVLKAICSSFINPLQECDGLQSGPIMSRVFIAAHYVTGGFSATAFVLMIFCILVLGVVNGYLYRRHLVKLLKRSMREEVMLEVQSHMAEYSKMVDGDNI